MKNHKSQKWENRGQNERRHLSHRRVLEHCKQPQSWELGALCRDAALGATVLHIVGKRQQRHPSACWLLVMGTKSRGGKGKQPLLFPLGVCGVHQFKCSLASGLYLLIKFRHQVFPSTPWPLCPQWHDVYCPCQDSLQYISLAMGKLRHQAKSPTDS